jgi:hypothetical protein
MSSSSVIHSFFPFYFPFPFSFTFDMESSDSSPHFPEWLKGIVTEERLKELRGEIRGELDNVAVYNKHTLARLSDERSMIKKNSKSIQGAPAPVAPVAPVAAAVPVHPSIRAVFTPLGPPLCPMSPSPISSSSSVQNVKVQGLAQAAAVEECQSVMVKEYPEFAGKRVIENCESEELGV